MDDFKDKVAVVTGAASGIGRGIAERCVQEGMKVVLADIEGQALHQAEMELRGNNADVLALLTDVSKPGDVESLAQKTLKTYGAVHILFNNAGVGGGNSIWQSTLADWQWVMGVNLWGQIYALRIFVPLMLAQDTDCYIVNTASIAGLLSYHPSAAYQVTKHAVVALSEHLYHSLAEIKAKVHVSVLCPGWVNTRIMDSERNRPLELLNGPVDEVPNPERERTVQYMRQAVQTGISPQQVADRVFTCIKTEQFYILTDEMFAAQLKTRLDAILQQSNPP